MKRSPKTTHMKTEYHSIHSSIHMYEYLCILLDLCLIRLGCFCVCFCVLPFLTHLSKYMSAWVCKGLKWRKHIDYVCIYLSIYLSISIYSYRTKKSILVKWRRKKEKNHRTFFIVLQAILIKELWTLFYYLRFWPRILMKI